MKVATIRRALKEAGSWDTAVAMGMQEILNRDAEAERMGGDSAAIRRANKNISRALAGFAAPEFWAESTAENDVAVAFQLHERMQVA